MIEILDNLDVLRQPILDLSTLTLAGVAYGAEAATISRRRITEVTFSPIVSSYEQGKYLDKTGAPLPFDDVVDSVLHASGILHFASDISFGINAGRVVRFSLYGRTVSCFAHLKTYEDFAAAFGVPDSTRHEELEGELVSLAHYYSASRKWVWWNADSGVEAITLGGTESDSWSG